MKFPWYAHNLADYDSKTATLSIIQHGAYRLLMDHYYRTGGALEANASDLLRVCRAVDEAERAAVLWVLAKFFVERDGFYHLDRADEEIAKREAISQKRAAAGQKGGSQPKAKRAASATATGQATGKQLLKQEPTQEHIHIQEHSLSSPTGKKESVPRERAGVRKAPAPPARHDTEALAASLVQHEPDWADRDPVWAQIKPEISPAHWRMFFHNLKETDTPGEYVASSAFEAERLETDFGPMLQRKLGYEPKFKAPPRRSVATTPTSEARH